jgi:hypothetical protein
MSSMDICGISSNAPERPDGDADERKDCGVTEHHAPDVARPRAERHPDADLARALTNRERHDAVYSPIAARDMASMPKAPSVPAMRCDSVGQSMNVFIVMIWVSGRSASSRWNSEVRAGASTEGSPWVRSSTLTPGR